MINEFLKTYKDGGMVYLDPTERDRIVEEINRLKRIDESHQRLNGELREENNKLHNIINEIEEELERESNMKEEDTCLEHNTFIDIRNTLKAVLKRLQELKGSDKE